MFFWHYFRSFASSTSELFTAEPCFKGNSFSKMSQTVYNTKMYAIGLGWLPFKDVKKTRDPKNPKWTHLAQFDNKNIFDFSLGNDYIITSSKDNNLWVGGDNTTGQLGFETENANYEENLPSYRRKKTISKVVKNPWFASKGLKIRSIYCNPTSSSTHMTVLSFCFVLLPNAHPSKKCPFFLQSNAREGEGGKKGVAT